ncbi:branched-chain amino acid ABC transporter permease [Serpentinicella sp. ANB-PHB4]|uniref:branched-chain amino acid ABC transporter permease n=1 Tax=Serpentinicella sp. ANB-PHB4 TaxID=3074076 RepID=UPI002857887F|nr:branched-chain amino acid ABC transporter permease [Serpentinicella sp. ANB-PHB4]MDR5659557.1 branched-chain amino acid ABC transporter permease [Serpentinicella sp. ANB-PHB4]
MTTFLQNVIAGIETGSLYALAALGVVLIYRVSSVTNFAQGEMAMLSSFVAYTLWKNLSFIMGGGDLTYIVAFIGALIFAMLFGYLVERIFIRPALRGSLVGKMIITLGLIMIVNGTARAIFGTDTHAMRRAITRPSFYIGNLLIRPNAYFIIFLTLIIMFILFYLIRNTIFGVAIRATAENETTARLMGIPTKKISSASWIIATVLGAIAGILIAPATNVHTNMMADVHLKSFIAAVLGGFTSFVGPVIGGLIIGIMDNLVGYYISSKWRTVIVYGFLILILVIKPAGLFGKVTRKKV